MMPTQGYRPQYVLARCRDGCLEPLAELPVPDGWIGHIAIVDEAALSARRPDMAADLQVFRGGANAAAELSENHDAALRALAADEIEDHNA